MSMTTKDLVSDAHLTAEAAAPAEASGGISQVSRRIDAVGAEVPVTVHASRYSATSRAAGKNLPAIHEQTRTVIVFPTGAVVRLTASITAGEVVVLTNQQTGADAICRVVSLKTQPGIQNYVNLEFTQRAPGFWGEAAKSDHPIAAEWPVESSAPVAAQSPAAAPLTAPTRDAADAVPVTVAPEPQTRPELVAEDEIAPAKSEQLDVPNAPAERLLKPSQVMAAVQPAQTAPQHAAPQPPAVATEPIAPFVASPVQLAAPVAEPAVKFGAAVPAQNPGNLSLHVPSVLSSHASSSTVLSPFGTSHASAQAVGTSSVRGHADSRETFPEQQSGSKKILMIAGAAVALLVLGGLGGAALFRQSPAKAPAQQVATSQPIAASQLPVQTAAASAGATVAAPKGTSSPAAQPATVAAAATVKTAIEPVKAQPVVETPVRHSNVAVPKLAAPVRTNAATASIEPPPVLAVQQSSLAGGNLLGDAVRTAGPAMPEVPGAAVANRGGQVEPARLLSSPAAVYPEQARLQRIQGTVIIDVLVDATGKVTPLKAISGPALLQIAALKALAAWKYSPALSGGHPVDSHVQVKVDFRLQ